MKNSFKILAAIAAFGFVGTANAQTSASADATASARIVTPIQLKKHCDLGFGSIIANEGGSVIISSEGPRSSTGAVQLTEQQQQGDGRVGPAKYNVCGEPNFAFNVTIPSTVDLNGLSVATSGPSSGMLDVDGKANFSVGGTLTVPSGAAPGSYSATFETTVSYQ